MSNYNWVCFSCKIASRKVCGTRNVPCQHCGAPCVNLGYKIPIPPKSKPKLWEKLRLETYLGAHRRRAERIEGCLNRIRDYDAEIQKLEARPETEGRTGVIVGLKELRDKGWEALRLLG